MTPKAKHKRKKYGQILQEHLVHAAQRTSISPKAQYLDYQHHDGTLIHRVVWERRSFDARWNQWDPGEWVERSVFSTRCGRVLAVGSVNITKTQKAPTCIRCAIPEPVWYSVGVDWSNWRLP